MLAYLICLSGDRLIDAIAANSKDAWSTEKIITVLAACFLVVYSVKLVYEHWQDDQPEDTLVEASLAECAVVATPHPDEENPEAARTQGVAAAGSDTDEVPPLGLGSKKINGQYQELTEVSTSERITPRRQNSSRSLSLSVHTPTVCDTQELKRTAEDCERAQALMVIAFIGSMDDLTLFVPMLAGKGFDIVQLILGGFSAASAILVFCMFVGLFQPVANCLRSIPLFAIVIAFAVTLLIKAFMMG